MNFWQGEEGEREMGQGPEFGRAIGERAEWTWQNVRVDSAGPDGGDGGERGA